MKTKPKCYKWPVYVQKEIYDFMRSPQGVGTAFFHTAFHNESERKAGTQFSYVFWFKTKNEALNHLIWLIDWFHAAKNEKDHKCYFANAGLVCGLTK